MTYLENDKKADQNSNFPQSAFRSHVEQKHDSLTDSVNMSVKKAAEEEL